MNGRTILSVLLIISAILVLGVSIYNYSQIPNGYYTYDTKNQLFIQIFGFGVLFFVVFCVIWAIPETTTNKPKTKTDEMLEKGYVFNVETGEWEKPKKS